MFILNCKMQISNCLGDAFGTNTGAICDLISETCNFNGAVL